MNRNTFAALFLDALYQVLDNKVFRILAVMVVGLVAATFLIGAREDGLVLAFGLERLAYEDIFRFFGLPYPGSEGAGEMLVQNVQALVLELFAGAFGIMFAIAATAFFVPRMLEKGAADTLFSKPVSRGMLLFARYLAGLLFVAVLSITLVGGMQVGFLVSSGYSDPGFLWSIVTLTYAFAMLRTGPRPSAVTSLRCRAAPPRPSNRRSPAPAPRAPPSCVPRTGGRRSRRTRRTDVRTRAPPPAGRRSRRGRCPPSGCDCG